jgi:O-antigen/teichoic acid export membrane protein
MAFGLPNLPNSLFVQVIELADRRILTALRSIHEQGIYSAGYKLGLFLSIVAMGFRYAWQPFFMNISNQPDAKEVYARVLTYYMALTFWLYLLLTAFVVPIATWIIPGIGRALIAPEYWEGLRVFPVVLLAQVFNGAFAVFMVGVYIQKRMHAIPFVTGVAAAINVGVNLAFVPTWGMWAAAWATVASYVSMTVLLYVYIQRYYPIAWEWGRIAHLMVMAVIVYVFGEIGRGTGSDWIGYLFALLYPVLLVITKFATPTELARIGIKPKQ